MEHPGVRIINIKDPTGLIILGPRTAAALELWAPGDHYETDQDMEGFWSWRGASPGSVGTRRGKGEMSGGDDYMETCGCHAAVCSVPRFRTGIA